MTTTISELDRLLQLPSEDEHLEFKLATNSFDLDELFRYCVAIANEGGGRIVLGVSNAHPRQVRGTRAHRNIQDLKLQLFNGLHRRLEVEEIAHPNGRVVIVHVPGRPRGVPLEWHGAYLMRVGESLTSMTPDQLRRIMDEAVPDASALPIESASLADLDPDLIEAFRRDWIRKSGNASLAHVSREQLLSDAGLILAGRVTLAAIAMLGTVDACRRLLPQAEIIFEYRSSEAALPAQHREAIRRGFLGTLNEVWELVNRRNDRQSYQDGLFRFEVPTFDEGAVREVLLNALSHRDYHDPGSVFIRQFPRRLEIVSPGGFPPGITRENVLDRQLPRNRTIAEALEHCGLVERSGQGMNRIYEASIKQGKPLPDLEGTDSHQVRVSLRGELLHSAFVKFLEKLGRDRLDTFTTHDLLALDLAHRGEKLPERLRARVDHLVEVGALERVGRKVILSRELYAAMGSRAAYTRRKGLDHDSKKSLLMQHILENSKEGAPLSDLVQVLPNVPELTVKRLLQELKRDRKIQPTGQRRWARWVPVAPGDDSLNK